MNPLIMIMAGGTGGHVFPGLAVARCLREQNVGVVWLGTRAGIEARLVPAAGFEIEHIQIRGLRGRGLLRWLLLPMQLNIAMFQAWRILRRRQPQAVLSMGGFVAGPGGLMASLLRIPLIIHEANAIPGLTNRWLAYLADRVLCGFPPAFGAYTAAHQVGNPVRREIAALVDPAQRFAGRTGRLRLLVVGGSQGAKVFNEVLPPAIAALPAAQRPEVWHQCGRGMLAATQPAYAGTDAKVMEFIDDMAAAYGWADLVLCRSGAMTVAELAAAGVGAILVPYPHAVDDHQRANARYLVERDAAVLLPQGEFNVARIGELLAEFAGNREVLVKMARAARACAITDAADVVARECREAAHA
jgi:UDP-N-acetylglucosamine--N-acetylmuramyl-(pentapeptide) pyrophosphoryl-undecaprenol N-acetylglucosamine transferase